MTHPTTSSELWCPVVLSCPISNPLMLLIWRTAPQSTILKMNRMPFTCFGFCTRWREGLLESHFTGLALSVAQQMAWLCLQFLLLVIPYLARPTLVTWTWLVTQLVLIPADAHLAAWCFASQSSVQETKLSVLLWYKILHTSKMGNVPNNVRNCDVRKVHPFVFSIALMARWLPLRI